MTAELHVFPGVRIERRRPGERAETRVTVRLGKVNPYEISFDYATEQTRNDVTPQIHPSASDRVEVVDALLEALEALGVRVPVNPEGRENG
jgi:hypothetical protein